MKKKNPIDFESIENKLAKLRENIDILENLKKTQKEEFLKNKEKSKGSDQKFCQRKRQNGAL